MVSPLQILNVPHTIDLRSVTRDFAITTRMVIDIAPEDLIGSRKYIPFQVRNTYCTPQIMGFEAAGIQSSTNTESKVLITVHTGHVTSYRRTASIATAKPIFANFYPAREQHADCICSLSSFAVIKVTVSKTEGNNVWIMDGIDQDASSF